MAATAGGGASCNAAGMKVPGNWSSQWSLLVPPDPRHRQLQRFNCYIREGMTQFDAIFTAMQATGVRYVVVGGVAVNLHGYQRFTKDVDLVIELIPDQARKALEALQAIGYRPNVPVKLADFADPEIRESWIRDKGMLVLQLFSDKSRITIDILTKCPIDFETLWIHGTTIELPGSALRIASIDHLIRMKREAGRAQDLADIEKLEKLKHVMNEPGENSA